MKQNKKLGQVFLHDNNILDKILEASDIQLTDHVVEIGCGKGVLTKRLAAVAKTVDVIEIDERWIEVAQDECREFSNIRFIHADIVKRQFLDIQQSSFSIVANIPYQVSAKIIQAVIEERSRIKKAVLMIQHEFANKLLAKEGQRDYGSLGIYTQFYCDITKEFPVSRRCFFPVPKVDSAVITLTPRNTPLFDVDADLFFKIIHASFWGRRKTLLNCLLHSPHTQFDSRISEAAFFKKYPQRRGETLSISEFYSLYQDIRSIL